MTTPVDGDGPPSVTIERVTEVRDELVEAMARLIPQLSRSAPPPGVPELVAMVASPAIALFVARNAQGQIVGSLTLVFFRIPTGVRALIEDVVVDQAARGTGTGAALTGAALAVATAEGARTVDLTSRPEREAANRLYQRLGFQLRNSNVYRYTLDG